MPFIIMAVTLTINLISFISPFIYHRPQWIGFFRSKYITGIQFRPSGSPVWLQWLFGHINIYRRNYHNASTSRNIVW
jgi:hypothetical protein